MTDAGRGAGHGGQARGAACQVFLYGLSLSVREFHFDILNGRERIHVIAGVYDFARMITRMHDLHRGQLSATGTPVHSRELLTLRVCAATEMREE